MCSDIANHFAKVWDVTVGRTTVGDILRSKEKVRMYQFYFKKSCS